MFVCVGSYTSTNGATGLTTFWRDATTGDFERASEAPMDSPSFVVASPATGTLHAVNEIDAGTVTTARVSSDGELDVVSQVAVEGSGPCYGALTPDEAYLITANYGDGTLSVLAVDASGMATRVVSVFQRSGSGADNERQRSPHPHMILMLPTESGRVSFLVADLGTDEIVRYGLSGDGVIEPQWALPVRPGTGPRHLAFTAAPHTWVVSGELDSSLLTISETETGPVIVQQRPSCSDPGEQAQSQPSHILSVLGIAAPRSQTVLIANRGINQIRELALEQSPTRVPIDIDVGKEPRHFAWIDGDVYVAAQHSNRIERITGCGQDPSRPRTVTKVADLPSPTCVVQVNH